MNNPLDDLVDEAGDRPDVIWKAVGMGAGVLGALAARKLIVRFQRGDPQSRNRASAAMWASVITIAAAGARAGAQRAVAAAWVRRNRRRAAALPA